MACEFTIEQIIEATGGEVLSQVQNKFHGVGTDTRRSLKNEIFIALKGDAYDAHQFLPEATQQGAACLLVHAEPESVKNLKSQVTIIKVNDTLRALQDLGRYWRKKLKAKVVGITGSNGKTSTKEFTAAILSSQFKVHYSKGSYNNHWGVPLTLLGASLTDDVCVCEMGMNHIGELTQLSKIATPDIVLCTMVGRAHIGNFGGSQQAVADAKEEIYLANPKAIKIFNCDNEYTIKMFDRVSKLQGLEKVFAFSSFSAGAEVSLRATHIEFDGLRITGHIGGVKDEVKVPVFGRQNTINLMAAASVGLVLKMEPEKIWEALQRCHSEWGRSQVVKLANGTTVLFDAYNANPDSMAALIKNIFEMNLPRGARKVAILGEMLELGVNANKYHKELGEMVGNTDFEIIWFMGQSQAAFSAGLKTSGFSKCLLLSASYEESLAKKVASMLNPLDVVVMKGSRGMRLEQVLKKWNPQFTTY